MNPDAMKAHVAEFFDVVWNSRNLSKLHKFIALQYTIRSDPGDPWDGRTLTREEFAERLNISCAPFPNQRFSIADLMADSSRVVVNWRLQGTHLSALPGFPASGRSVKTSGITIYDFENGLLRGHRQQADRLSVFQQLSAKA